MEYWFFKFPNTPSLLQYSNDPKLGWEATLRVAVDIGGTFTDVVVFDEAKSDLALAKALSTPAELARGVLEGLTKAAVPL